MSKIIWSKITETKEVCNITLNSIIIGKLIVDKDLIDDKKWMCYFEGFPYSQIFSFDNQYKEMYKLNSKENAKQLIMNQFTKIINTLYIFSSEINKKYLE